MTDNKFLRKISKDLRESTHCITEESTIINYNIEQEKKYF